MTRQLSLERMPVRPFHSLAATLGADLPHFAVSCLLQLVAELGRNPVW